MTLSGLCLVHCLGGALLLALLSLGGGILGHEVHALGFAAALPLAAVGLVRGYRRHRRLEVPLLGLVGLLAMAGGLLAPHGLGTETVATVCGVTILGLSHLANGRLAGGSAPSPSLPSPARGSPNLPSRSLPS